MRCVALDRITLSAVDPDWQVAGDSHPIEPARMVVVIRDTVMLGDAVVEEHQLTRLPTPAKDVLRTGHVGLQKPQDVARLAGREADNALREPADEEVALTGKRVHPHHGMGRLI